MEIPLERLELTPDFFNPDQDFLGTKGLILIGDQVLVYRRTMTPLCIKVSWMLRAVGAKGANRRGRHFKEKLLKSLA